MRRIFFATLILMPILAAAADKVEVYDEYKGCGGNWNLSMRTMILDESADEFAAQVAMGDLLPNLVRNQHRVCG
jgi:hypothetical protein